MVLKYTDATHWTASPDCRETARGGAFGGSMGRHIYSIHEVYEDKEDSAQ